MRFLASTCYALLLVGCNDEYELPKHIADMVEQYESNAGPAPNEIWRYRFDGEMVYYFPPMPYDVPSTLVSADGDFICSPDGGLTGDGDGKCPDFFEQRRGGKIVWRNQ